MYVKKLQLMNYGPIGELSLELPFENEMPKPLVLVGTNGSGKSIALSHVVNGLLIAQGAAFPETPEVESNKVYKLRSSTYIKEGREFSFSRVEYEGGFFVSEIRTMLLKEEYTSPPLGVSGTSVEPMWNKVVQGSDDFFDSNSSQQGTKRFIEEAFRSNCVLYFPFNRFEEPAWLNLRNLLDQAQYMDIEHISGYTSRKVIAASPLRDNRNWLFDVIFDRSAFELQTQSINVPVNNGSATVPLPVFAGYSGYSNQMYEAALKLVQAVTRREDATFRIGGRKNRVVAMQYGSSAVAPNIFQLSSGETSLINLFLSILRDFDLSGASFSGVGSIRGIVLVDEVDLHLHSVYQYEVLPSLIKMFPKVQFIVTTHSPLFVLGMQKVFGDEGFVLYQLPQGQQISPEEFSEFGEAYTSFANSQKFTKDLEEAIARERKPVLLPEGATDIRYLERAAELFGKQDLLATFVLRDGGGAGTLKKIFNGFRGPLPELLDHAVVLLLDCDENKEDKQHGRLYQRQIPPQAENPVKTGIENLFSKASLERALEHDPSVIDIEREHEGQIKGVTQTVPEKWALNQDRKSDLCDWLCNEGTAEDFEAFNVIFDMLAEVVQSDSEQTTTATANQDTMQGNGFPDAQLDVPHSSSGS